MPKSDTQQLLEDQHQRILDLGALVTDLCNTIEYQTQVIKDLREHRENILRWSNHKEGLDDGSENA